MIVYQNWLITIDFNPAFDILSAELPNVSEYGLAELSRALDMVAEHVISYDASNLLLDSSRVMVSQIQDDAYKKLIWKFLVALTATRLKRFARLNDSLQSHEVRALSVTDETFMQLGSPIEFMSFSRKEDAAEWLKAGRFAGSRLV